jgi:hypothetical protein
MKIPAALFLAVSSCFFSSGCDELLSNQKPKVQVVKENRVPVRRFILTKYSADVAFDSQTGQLCKTWEWEPTAKLTPAQEASGTHPQRALGEISPLCLNVYTKYPSGIGTSGEALADE